MRKALAQQTMLRTEEFDRLLALQKSNVELQRKCKQLKRSTKRAIVNRAQRNTPGNIDAEIAKKRDLVERIEKQIMLLLE